MEYGQFPVFFDGRTAHAGTGRDAEFAFDGTLTAEARRLMGAAPNVEETDMGLLE
ncbi:hypothetical protein [Ectobacillus panaciterrae]|uniref:hypothetical protein n=1 Tax=Ectobacillus panaciterrae TaxID=363872 RepID=UPI0003F792FA|nr:hypothetical protein [Ectobacillus panaciterrae]